MGHWLLSLHFNTRVQGYDTISDLSDVEQCGAGCRSPDLRAEGEILNEVRIARDVLFTVVLILTNNSGRTYSLQIRGPLHYTQAQARRLFRRREFVYWYSMCTKPSEMCQAEVERYSNKTVN